MQRDIDQALNYLRSHLEKLEALLHNHYSEADTRVKFIDPVLTNVLGWTETPHIQREERYSETDEQRCIDYTISLNEPVLVVEAKKFLKDFEIPTTTGQTRFKLDGVIQKWTNAWSAVQQARAYCDKKGARYALVTNGRQYIAFKAISERPGGWTKGYALVWRSPEDLLQRFTQFYECLSRETIAQDRLPITD